MAAHPATVAAVLALVVAIAAAAAAWWGTVAALNRLNGEYERERRALAQRAKVYDVLTQATAPADKRAGVTFEEIRTRYADEAAGTVDADGIPADDLRGPGRVDRVPPRGLHDRGQVRPAPHPGGLGGLRPGEGGCRDRPSPTGLIGPGTGRNATTRA